MKKLRILSNGNLPFEKNGEYKAKITTAHGVTFSECFDIPVKDITLNHVRNQVRTGTKDVGHVQDTAAQIVSKGLIDPVVVSIDNNGVIVMESGHHRLDAFKNLNRETIPAYVVTYGGSTQKETEIIRARFLQTDNDHPTRKPMGIKDAEKFLFNLKKNGYFSGMSDPEIKKEAAREIKKYYSHFTEAKIKQVVAGFMKGISPPSYRQYSTKDRAELAKLFKYTSKPSEFDRNNSSYYVNGLSGNCLKQVATIDKFAEIPSDIDPSTISIDVFCSTNARDLASCTSNRAEFLAKMKVANTNYSRFQVRKVFLMPDLVAQTECEIHVWTVDEKGIGSFVKQEKST